MLKCQMSAKGNKIMKNFYSIGLIFVLLLGSFGFNVKYAYHTSSKDIEYKKAKALGWYDHNSTNKFIFWPNAKKEVVWLKNRALRWYEYNVTDKNLYFVNPEKELSFLKSKSLKWYEKNSD